MKKIFKFFSISFWIEQISKNHLNVFLTLWMNFHFLPFRQAICLPLFVYGKMKFFKTQGSLRIDASKIYSGMITLNKRGTSSCFSSGDSELAIYEMGCLIFKGAATIGCGCLINVNIGTLVIGDGVKINNQNNIGCFNRIEIGRNTRIGHQNQVFDTNFHHIKNVVTNEVKRSNAPIFLGENCWIANRVTIMPGVNLPDATIVSSNSLVSKNVATASCQIIGGIPARLLKENMARVWDLKLEHDLHFLFRDENVDNFHLK